jgi:subtilisin family serine protease
MSLFGGADILDRTKLRVYYRFLGLPFTLTENSSMPPVVVLRDGPVRVIASRGASLTRAYGSFLQTTTPVDLTSLDFITIDELRISTDLTNTITNGTYYNENVPGGVTIDGITDTVPATPFVNAWRQVSLDDGTTIQVVDLGALDGTPSHYYRDDGVTVVDGADTGDQRSFGDSGVRVISPTATLFTVESAQFVLPGRQANRGAEFYAYFRNPLLVSIRAEGEQYVYLPLIMNSAGAQGQIDPFVLDELAAKGRVNVFVKMVEEAALETDEQGVSPMERVQAVHDRLTVQATSSQENITRFLDSQGIPYTSFWINNSLYVYQADLALVRALAQREDVAYVRGDHQVPRLLPVVHESTPQHATVEWGLQKINADDVWATGHTGQGVVVASIDTGVRYTHEALVNQYRGNNGDGTFSHDYNWWDPLRTYAAPTDLSGHGTHTMGTMVGGDAFGPLTPDVGVAPGAQWIAAKGCGLIFCSDFALISSAQWIACPTRLDGSAPDCSKAPQVVNNSWGTRAGDPFYLSYVRAWLAAGIVPVFAIGNGGPGCRTATSPGDYRYVIGVGATNQDDVLAFFSSRGPGFFRWLKPDFVAPGAWVRSAFHTGDAAYAVLSGTSMAAPHVSGTIALMLSAHPDARLASLYKGLYTTAVTDLGNPPGLDACAGRRYDLYPNTTYGWGRIDALAAVNALP